MITSILPMAAHPTGPANRRVVAVAYDGLCMFEFGVATELFGLDRPELDVDWYEFTTVAADSGPIRATGGISLDVTTGLDKIEKAGTIVLPGWRDPNEAPPAELTDALLAAHANGARLMSICSGVFVLAATGLLSGAAATTHWRYAEQLAERHPEIDVRPDILYVDNGSVLTSAGSAAGIDLGLHLIRRDYGSAVANEVARRLVVPAHRDGGQAQFIQRPVTHHDDHSISTTLDWALERLDEPLTVSDLAAHAHMSERSFARRFGDATGTTPHRWLTRNRVDRARHLLETTSLSIALVAERSGLGSTANLRTHFERELQTTPSQYRQRFSLSR